MTSPTITRLWDSSVRLQFPYDAELIDALKTEIPVHARRYDPTTKAWTITALYAGMATRLMYEAFDHVVEVNAADAGPFADRGDRVDESDPWVILHLRPTAPPELVAAAYRCLARLHHPDRGGSTTTMQAINAAVDAIREVA